MKKTLNTIKSAINEKDLVSFGNYLLAKYKVKRDGVTDCDLSNWKELKK